MVFPLVLFLLGGVAADGDLVTFEVAGTTWCSSTSRFLNRARDMMQQYAGLEKANFTYYPDHSCKKDAVTKECATDMSSLQACLKEYLNNRAEDYLQALPCCQDRSQTLDGALQCISKLAVAGKLKIDDLKTCGSGLEGRNYLADVATDFHRVTRGCGYWPWTVLDGQRVKEAEFDPWKEVCKRLTPKPKECA